MSGEAQASSCFTSDVLRAERNEEKAERPVAKKAEAIYEATKVANFAASSLLEGIRISADAELSTLEQVRRRYKQ